MTENWTGEYDAEGKKVPFPCGVCFAPSCYGFKEKWYCTSCWSQVFWERTRDEQAQGVCLNDHYTTGYET